MEDSRKALKEQYKNRKVVGGVYRIKCSEINGGWLRSTTDMKGAENRYRFLLSTGTCPEPSMAKAWDQFGPSSFSFEVVEELEKKETQTDREFINSRSVWVSFFSSSSTTSKEKEEGPNWSQAFAILGSGQVPVERRNR